MGVEIERKFLVRGDDWRAFPGTDYAQGYLSRDPDRTVRVRLAGEQAWLTVKGRSRGASRLEFEYPVPAEDARSMLELCDGPALRKVRRRIPHAGLVWEVDEFLGENAGLVVAEVELEAEDQPFEKPGWAGEEVTGDPRYFNSNLAVAPWRTWQGPAGT